MCGYGRSHLPASVVSNLSVITSPWIEGPWTVMAYDAFHLLMDTRKTIGWNLRRLRIDKGISQERLALDAGIDRSYTSRVERGIENVTIATLDAYARVLQVNVRELFNEPNADSVLPKPMKSGRKSISR